MPYRKSSPPHPLLAILFAGCCACAAQATTLYRWVDSTGITHWSDRPTPGSTAVEMGAAQGYPAPAVPASNATSPRAGAVHFVLYSDVAITAPAPGGVLYDTGGVVLCAAQLNPPLAPGHALWFELDGRRYDAQGATTLSLPAARGEHVLRALVTDADGHEQIRSAAVTFYVRQATIASPPVGPTLQRPH